MDESKEIISQLIDDAIEKIYKHSLLVKKSKRPLTDQFIQSFYSQLKSDLLNEIVSEIPPDANIDYVSLSDIFPQNTIIFAKIGDVDVKIFKHVNYYSSNGIYQINLVFPCRNSGKIISNSIELLISEISKSHDIDFNVIFQVNNTRDDTIRVVVETLQPYIHVVNNANFFIVESPSDLQFSLPGSLNLGHEFICSIKDMFKHKYLGEFFSFWDDELVNLIPTQDSLFNSNLNELLNQKTAKAISGYMIDNRVGLSRWHEVCKGFSSDIRFIDIKPYLHGGAGTVMRLEDYPKDGIKLGGIADTDLSEHLIRMVGYKRLKLLQDRNWPVRINHRSPVFHPIEDNILKWTTKYLMYQIAWKNTFNSLSENGNLIGDLWKKRIKENRLAFHKSIDTYIKNLSTQKILEREFMHYYYSTVQNIRNKSELYDLLKKYRARSLEMRKSS